MKKLLWLGLLFLLPTAAFGGIKNNSVLLSKDSTEQFKGVAEVVKEAIEDSAFPGAVVLVEQNGKILYEKGFGHFTYDQNSTEDTRNTIFDMASVSKVISTTTATMLCYDRGLFKLDDKVAEYIPEFGSNGKEDVTIRNLLVHNSGLRPDIVNYHAYASSPDPEKEILHEIYNDSLVYKTGSKMVYSDENMIVMAKIIEKVTGKPLDEFTKEEIFEPLGMNNTMYNPPDSLKV